MIEVTEHGCIIISIIISLSDILSPQIRSLEARICKLDDDDNAAEQDKMAAEVH